MIADSAREANATGRGQPLQPSGDVDAVSVNVIAVGNHVAEIDPNAEPDPPLLAHLRLALGHPALDLHGASDGINYTGELRQEAIAGVLHSAAPVLRDLRLDQFPEMRLQAFVRAFLIGAHKAGIAGDISGEDRSKTAGLA